MEKYHCSQVWMEKKWLGYSTSLPLCFGVEGHCFQLKKLLQPTLGFGLALETRFPFGLVIDPLPTNFLIYALLELLQQTSVSTGCQESKWLAPAKDRPVRWLFSLGFLLLEMAIWVWCVFFGTLPPKIIFFGCLVLWNSILTKRQPPKAKSDFRKCLSHVFIGRGDGSSLAFPL